MVSKAARARAAEAEHRRTVKEDLGYVRKIVLYDDSSLKKLLDDMPKAYKKMHPSDMLINPNTGTEYTDPKYRKQLLRKKGDDRFKFFSNVRDRIVTRLEAGMKLSKVKKLFHEGPKEDRASRLRTLHRILAKKKEIIDELDEVVKYWDGVKDSGKLPKVFRRKFNDKTLAHPLEKIEKDELDLLALIDSLLSMKKREEWVKP